MTDKAPPKPTVFISYSHKDEVWKDRLTPQLRALEQAGRIVVWDDRKIDGGEKWYPEIKQAMEEAAVAVCIVSPDYLASGFCVNEEVPFLLERCERDGMIFIPLLLRPCAWKAFEWLKEIQMLPRDGKSVVVDFRGIEDAAFADVANLILRIVDNPAEYKLPTRPAPIWSPPEKINIERLPVTGAEVFGRQQDLELLDEAWASADTNIVSLVAWGGVGKSTLVNKWIERMQDDNYRGARRVYAWSFYSQGTGERVTSADQFINHALTWFGDPDPTAGSPWDKGERLANLIRTEKTLLVLDGLEPLQSGQAFERGKIREPALVTLLTQLARQGNGLCLITTREKATDLEEFPDSVVQKDLEQITDEAGRALLRVGGVQGTDAELEQVTRNFGNHALAINLLAVYLNDTLGRHVSKAAAIPDLDIPEEKGKHPRRVMTVLADRFGNGPEVELLKMLGLFDRPADKASLRALRKAPPIHGLSDHIRKLTDAGWLRVIEELRRYRLIAPKSQHRADDLDAHPLVREHFGELLKEYPDAWRAGNWRLYEHLRRSAKVFPNTLVEMAPLYAAVVHGCEAGKYQECFEAIYRNRILRGNQFFSIYILGSHSTDLSVLSKFFSSLWGEPVDSLDEAAKGFLLNAVGYALQQVARLTEAIQPMQAALESAISRRNWFNASTASVNLSFLYLNRGDLIEAVLAAKSSVELADKGAFVAQHIASRAALGQALHHVGRLLESETAFQDAEGLLKKHSPQYSHLHSTPGFQFCALLLDQGKYQEVQARASRSLNWIGQSGWSQAIALDKLLLGRAFLLQSEQQGSNNLSQASTNLRQAVDGLRQAGSMMFLPQGLLARAEIYRITGDFISARTDLNEAVSLSIRGSMKVYQADCHLAYARLYLAMSEAEENAEIKQENREKSREHCETAKEMIERMGYHRRDKDVKEIEEQLNS